MEWQCNFVLFSDLFCRSLNDQANSLPQFQQGIWNLHTMSIHGQKQSLKRSPSVQGQFYLVFYKSLRIWDNFYYHFIAWGNQNWLLSSKNHCQTLVAFCSVLSFIFISQKLLSFFDIIRTQGFHHQCTWTYLNVKKCILSVHVQVLG